MSWSAPIGLRTSAVARPERILFAFFFFSLFYFGYLYFFPFDEGVSGAPFAIKALKDGVYLLVLIALVPSISLTTGWREWIFAPLFVMLVVSSLIHAPQTGIRDQIWQNIKNVAIFIPIYYAEFWMSADQREWLIDRMFAVLLFASVIQCLFSFAYYWSGHHLWIDGVFAGLIGNPNSFSLILNLALCVILAFIPLMTRMMFIISLAVCALLFATILHAFSGSQSAIFIVLIAYAAIVTRAKWLRFLAVALVITATAIPNWALVRSNLYTMSGVDVYIDNHAHKQPTSSASTDIRTIPNNSPEYLSRSREKPLDNAPASTKHTQSGDGISTSVTGRVHVAELAFSVFRRPLTDGLFGSFSAKNFTPMDGQFFVFLYNGGLLLLLSFAIPCAIVYLLTLSKAWRVEDRELMALHYMITVFGITFLASRILMYYPLNFIFFMICGLAMANLKIQGERFERE